MALNLAGSCEYSSPVPMVNNSPTSAQRIHLHLHMMKSKKDKPWQSLIDLSVLTTGFSASSSANGLDDLDATPMRCGVLGGRFLQSNAKGAHIWKEHVFVSRVCCHLAQGCSKDIATTFQWFYSEEASRETKKLQYVFFKIAAKKEAPSNPWQRAHHAMRNDDTCPLKSSQHSISRFGKNSCENGIKLGW